MSTGLDCTDSMGDLSLFATSSNDSVARMNSIKPGRISRRHGDSGVDFFQASDQSVSLRSGPFNSSSARPRDIIFTSDFVLPL